MWCDLYPEKDYSHFLSISSEGSFSRPPWLYPSQSYLLPNNTTLVAHFLRTQKTDLICLVKAGCGMYACGSFHAAPEPQWTQTTNKAKRKRHVREKIMLMNGLTAWDGNREREREGAWNKFPAQCPLMFCWWGNNRLVKFFNTTFTSPITLKRLTDLSSFGPNRISYEVNMYCTMRWLYKNDIIHGWSGTLYASLMNRPLYSFIFLTDTSIFGNT